MDIARQIDAVPYELANPFDLAETVELVEERGGKILPFQADIRDQFALDTAVAEGISAFGPISIVVANAGISQAGMKVWTMTDEQWQTTVDVNLTGTWRTVKAVVPSMIEAGQGGSIVFTTSSTAVKAKPHVGAYVSSKFGMTGLMRVLSLELARNNIRVNAISPTAVPTPMLLTERMFKLFPSRPGAPRCGRRRRRVPVA